jgi:beta-phosphoglucomutase-like phosphatase (HAD superfamily)
MPLRAIIFDFDGVLANTEPLHLRAYQDVLAGEGVTLDEDNYYSRYLGFDDVGAFGAIGDDAGRAWTAADIARLVAAKARRLEALEQDVPVLFPGAADMVRRAAAVCPIAIASGALGAEIRRVLERERLMQHFTAIVAAEDTPVSKPSPEPYLRAVALLRSSLAVEIAPRECAAIEDSPWGLQSACAAGLRTVAVAQSYDASKLHKADLVINAIASLNLDELAQLFGS